MIGTVDVENNTPLVTSGWTIAAYDALAQTDALVSHDELVKNVLTIGNAVFDDPLLQRMAAQNETVEDGHAVGQSRSADLDSSRIDSILNGSFQNGQTNILFCSRDP